MWAPKDESQNDPPEIIVKINGSRDYHEYLKRHKLKLKGKSQTATNIKKFTTKPRSQHDTVSI
jgi:hypothetical protein